MKIAVAGTGYVGMSIATLLAQHNEVVAVDVLPEKVEMAYLFPIFINSSLNPSLSNTCQRFLTFQFSTV